MESLINIESIEILIFMFFIYSFAGWFFESVGGILFVKKFVNRGFLIGPCCPIYGAGVVAITVILDRFKDNCIVFFILVTLMSGVVEYTTSYIMEKLFNARWWDNSNRRFNINGRTCIGNMIVFGTVALMITYICNPILIKGLVMIPIKTRHIATVILSVAFILDFVFSFEVIVNFKGEIDKQEKDNTEEVSDMVKEKAEEMIMQAESSAIEITRDVKYVRIKVQRKVKYTGKKYTLTGRKLINEVAHRAINRKNVITGRIVFERDQLAIRLKSGKNYISSQIDEKKKQSIKFIKHNKQNIYNLTNAIIEKFSIKSVLNRRLMEAFPRLQIIFKRSKSETVSNVGIGIDTNRAPNIDEESVTEKNVNDKI